MNQGKGVASLRIPDGLDVNDPTPNVIFSREGLLWTGQSCNLVIMIISYSPNIRVASLDH